MKGSTGEGVARSRRDPYANEGVLPKGKGRERGAVPMANSGGGGGGTGVTLL
jgi:hypothetical protein